MLLRQDNHRRRVSSGRAFCLVRRTLSTALLEHLVAMESIGGDLGAWALGIGTQSVIPGTEAQRHGSCHNNWLFRSPWASRSPGLMKRPHLCRPSQPSFRKRPQVPEFDEPLKVRDHTLGQGRIPDEHPEFDVIIPGSGREVCRCDEGSLLVRDNHFGVNLASSPAMGRES